MKICGKNKSVAFIIVVSVCYLHLQGHFLSSQVTFIYIALLTIQIVSKQLHNIKIGK